MADPRRDAALAGVAVAGAFAAVAVLFVLPYVAQDIRYPLGWDSPFYVWRTAAVGFDGLAQIGGARPATPLLFNALGALTGEGPFTIAAIGPSLFAAVTALAAAGLLRSALGIGWGWVPFAALIAWMGFGHPGMVREQPDNVLNAACVLAAFAAAVSYVRTGRGWVAVAALLTAAGLAHWPFFGLALGVLGVGTLLFEGRRLPAQDLHARRGRRLLGAGAVATAVVGGMVFWRPEGAWSGPKLETLRDILRDRFLRRAGDVHRLPVVVLGGLGVAVASRRRDRPERRLFLWLMVAWIALTAIGLALQAAGIPTAGLRLLNNLFPLTLLAAAVVWWVGSRAGRRVSLLLAVVALAGFAALAIPFQLQGKPWYEPAAVEQAAGAGAWLERYAPDAEVDVAIGDAPDVLTQDRWRHTIRASLPPRIAANTDLSPVLSFPREIVLVFRAYNRPVYEDALARGLGTEITNGVVAFGNLPPGAVRAPSPPGPLADTSTRTIAVALMLGGIALGGAGLGWARALLPEDPVLRWCLAPAVGCAATALLGVAWAAIGLPLDGPAGAGPLALAALTGSGAALLRRESA